MALLNISNGDGTRIVADEVSENGIADKIDPDDGWEQQTPSFYQVDSLKEAAREYDGSQKIFIDKVFTRIKHFRMNFGQELHRNLMGY